MSNPAILVPKTFIDALPRDDRANQEYLSRVYCLEVEGMGKALLATDGSRTHLLAAPPHAEIGTLYSPIFLPYTPDLFHLIPNPLSDKHAANVNQLFGWGRKYPAQWLGQASRLVGFSPGVRIRHRQTLKKLTEAYCQALLEEAGRGLTLVGYGSATSSGYHHINPLWLDDALQFVGAFGIAMAIPEYDAFRPLVLAAEYSGASLYEKAAFIMPLVDADIRARFAVANNAAMARRQATAEEQAQP
jgi:hypothetical protein